MSKTALIKFIALKMSNCTPLISKWRNYSGKLEQFPGNNVHTICSNKNLDQLEATKLDLMISEYLGV